MGFYEPINYLFMYQPVLQIQTEWTIKVRLPTGEPK